MQLIFPNLIHKNKHPFIFYLFLTALCVSLCTLFTLEFKSSPLTLFLLFSLHTSFEHPRHILSPTLPYHQEPWRKTFFNKHSKQTWRHLFLQAPDASHLSHLRSIALTMAPAGTKIACYHFNRSSLWMHFNYVSLLTHCTKGHSI